MANRRCSSSTKSIFCQTANWLIPTGKSFQVGINQFAVWQKIDILPNRELVDSYLKRFSGSVAISARTGEGANKLVQALEGALSSWRLRSRFRIPANESALIAEIHRVGHVLELRYEVNDALIVAHVPPDLAQKLERYAEGS